MTKIFGYFETEANKRNYVLLLFELICMNDIDGVFKLFFSHSMISEKSTVHCEKRSMVG